MDIPDIPDIPSSFDVDTFLDEFEKKEATKSTHYVHKKAKLSYNQQSIFIRLCQHHTTQQQLESIYLKIFKKFHLSLVDGHSAAEWILNINHQTIAANDFHTFEALTKSAAPPLTIDIIKKQYKAHIHYNQRTLCYDMNDEQNYNEVISRISVQFGLHQNEILLYETIDNDDIYIEDKEDFDMVLSEFHDQLKEKKTSDCKLDLFVMKLSFEESLERLITKMHNDSIKFLCFEAPNISGQSNGSMVPLRNGSKFLHSGYQMSPAVLMTSINNTYAQDVLEEEAVLHSTGYGNIITAPYLDTYRIIPWFDAEKTAVITTHQLPEYDAIQPTDSRTLCVNLLSTLHDEFGVDIYHTIEQEYFILNKEQNLSISESGCYRMEKLQPVHDFLSVVDDYMQSMNINCERYHAEDASGQYETTIIPSWNIKGADDAYWLKNGIRQIATKYNKDWSVSFVNFPYVKHKKKTECDLFEHDTFKEPNGAHFNHSLWSTNANGDKISVFYDAKSENGLSDVCLYWIGGIFTHIRALTAFCCPTEPCYRRLRWLSLSDFASWGINSRKSMISVKGNKDKTYLEFRFPSALANPYLLLAAVLCAGMHGIRNKILPQDVAQKDKKIPHDLKEALGALETNPIVNNAFGELFIKCYIEIKRIEIDELNEYKQKKQRPLFYTLM